MFIAVYEAGNLSAVARTLSRTQPAVSQHIKRLERETGLTLIERQPRGVAPTTAGRILYEATVGGIGSVDAALRQLSELRDEVELYEHAAGPQCILIDRAQRSRAGQHARHVRRLDARVNHPG